MVRMDISLVKDNSIKIKGGRGGTTIVTDPASRVEAEVVLLTASHQNHDLDKVEGKRLVIEGPGEYEIGGISIVGKSMRGDVVFDISNDSKILLLSSSAVPKIQEEDEYDAVLIKVNGKISDDSFSVFNAKSFILYGDISQVSLKTDKKEVTNRVNLKKMNEIAGKIFLLSS